MNYCHYKLLSLYSVQECHYKLNITNANMSLCFVQSTLYWRIFDIFTCYPYQCNIHCTLYTVHYTLYILHYIVYTIHSTLYSVHYTVFIHDKYDYDICNNTVHSE